MNDQLVEGLWLDYSVLIILSGVSLAGVIYWVWAARKKYKGSSIGDIINIQLIKEKVTFFIGFVVFVNMAESMMAASIRVLGEAPPNPFTRWMIHMSIGLAGMVCGVYAFHYVRELAFRSKKSINKARSALIVGMLIFGAVAFPFMNLGVIAKGVGDLPLLMGFLRNPAAAMQGMTFVTTASFFATIAHIFIVMLDGLITSDDIKIVKYSAGKDVNEKVNEREEKNKQDKLDGVVDAVKFLLKRHGYKTTAGQKQKVFQAVVDDCNSKIDQMSSSEQYKLADNLHKLVMDIKQFDKTKKSSGKTDAENKAINEEFKKRITKLFAASTKGGKGFGRQLASRSGN